MATKKAAPAAAKKAAPKVTHRIRNRRDLLKAIPKHNAPEEAPEPAVVEAASLTPGDAHAVLDLDGKKFHLSGEIVSALRRAFEMAHSIVNPGH